LLLTVHSDPKNFIGKLPMILISPQKKAEHTRQYFSCLAQNKSPICNADKKRFSTLSAQLNLQQFDHQLLCHSLTLVGQISSHKKTIICAPAFSNYFQPSEKLPIKTSAVLHPQFPDQMSKSNFTCIN
jgi:hypothetical protein